MTPTPDASPGLRTVTVFHAAGCHLCDRALEVVAEARALSPFTIQLVDIGGDAALEAAYRELLPVIEIDGTRAFTYFVTVDDLVARLADDGSRGVPNGEAGNM